MEQTIDMECQLALLFMVGTASLYRSDLRCTLR